MSQHSSRKETIDPLPLINNLPSPQQDLCVHGQLIGINKLRKEQVETILLNKQTRKKSHKSLGIGLEMSIKKASLRVKQRRQPLKTQAVKQRSQTEDLTKVVKSRKKLQYFNQQKERKESPENYGKESELKSEEEPKQAKFHFAEKKMKIGSKKKSEMMKQFILETLSKGKVEGNCVTIDKGTAQCKHSPTKTYKKSEEHKSKPSLNDVQRRVPQRRLPPLGIPKSRLSNNSESKTSVRMASGAQSNRWVSMVRKWENGKNDIIPQEIKKQQQFQ